MSIIPASRARSTFVEPWNPESARTALGRTRSGAAQPLFVAGGKIKPVVIGEHLNLAPTDLLNGDPRFSLDLRSAYAAALEQ